MNGELVTVETEDHLLLQGLHCRATHPAPSAAVVLHLHGIYGNYYENTFLTPLAEAFNANGVGFLPFNSRGHDSFAQIPTREGRGFGSRALGGGREVFQDCGLDIEAWCNFAHACGYERILLEGHSLGAMKAVYYCRAHGDVVTALLLLSPPDHFGREELRTGGRLAEFLKRATELAGDESAVMPPPAYLGAITARSFLSLFAHPEDTGMFNYGDEAAMRRAGWGAIECPVLATFGTEQEAIVQSPKKCISAIRTACGRPNRVRGCIIEGADHLYHSRERELACAAAGWVREVLGAAKEGK